MSGCGGRKSGSRQALAVAFEESVDERITIARPSALTSRKIDRAQEPHDIDQRRASRGVVEVVEPPRVACERELFDVRIPVQPHVGEIAQVFPEHLADSRDPRPVDESEVIEGGGLQPLDQLR